MAYKLIDDDTALQIYEAVQENTDRSFGHYNRMRQLPRTKISGEIVFYLDALLDFSKAALGREEADTLQEVVDAGVVSWFSTLAPELQKKAGFSLADDGEPSVTLTVPKSDIGSRENEDTIESLSQKAAALEVALTGFRNENERLAKEIESLENDKVSLRREIAHLEQINEELMEKTLGQETAAVSGGPAFLAEASAGSVYTEMTTHLLSTSPKDKTSSSKKRSKKKRG